MVKNLYKSYLVNPKAVSALCAHLIIIDAGKLLPYEKWIKEYRLHVGEPSNLLFATGAGGVLYPVFLFNLDLLDEDVIRANCLYADEIWLKMMELEAGVPTVLSQPCGSLRVIPETQEAALDHYNKLKIDKEWEECASWLDRRHYPGFVMKRLTAQVKGEFDYQSKYAIIDYYEDKIRKKDQVIREKDAMIRNKESEIKDLWNSVSLRIGRILTWPGRKTRDVIFRKD